jgi:hypothetical protein
MCKCKKCGISDEEAEVFLYNRGESDEILLCDSCWENSQDVDYEWVEASNSMYDCERSGQDEWDLRRHILENY